MKFKGVEMKMSSMCPNCEQSPVDGHPENGCLLVSLIQVLRDRGEFEESDLQKIHAECSADLLWDALGPIVDRLGEGKFAVGDGMNQSQGFGGAESQNEMPRQR